MTLPPLEDAPDDHGEDQRIPNEPPARTRTMVVELLLGTHARSITDAVGCSGCWAVRDYSWGITRRHGHSSSVGTVELSRQRQLVGKREDEGTVSRPMVSTPVLLPGRRSRFGRLEPAASGAGYDGAPSLCGSFVSCRRFGTPQTLAAGHPERDGVRGGMTTCPDASPPSGDSPAVRRVGYIPRLRRSAEK